MIINVLVFSLAGLSTLIGIVLFVIAMGGKK